VALGTSENLGRNGLRTLERIDPFSGTKPYLLKEERSTAQSLP